MLAGKQLENLCQCRFSNKFDFRYNLFSTQKFFDKKKLILAGLFFTRVKPDENYANQLFKKSKFHHIERYFFYTDAHRWKQQILLLSFYMVEISFRDTFLMARTINIGILKRKKKHITYIKSRTKHSDRYYYKNFHKS